MEVDTIVVSFYNDQYSSTLDSLIYLRFEKGMAKYIAKLISAILYNYVC